MTGEASDCCSSTGSSSGDDEWLQELENEVASADSDSNTKDDSDNKNENGVNDFSNANAEK